MCANTCRLPCPITVNLADSITSHQDHLPSLLAPLLPPLDLFPQLMFSRSGPCRVNPQPAPASTRLCQIQLLLPSPLTGSHSSLGDTLSFHCPGSLLPHCLFQSEPSSALVTQTRMLVPALSIKLSDSRFKCHSPKNVLPGCPSRAIFHHITIFFLKRL